MGDTWFGQGLTLVSDQARQYDQSYLTQKLVLFMPDYISNVYLLTGDTGKNRTECMRNSITTGKTPSILSNLLIEVVIHK